MRKTIALATTTKKIKQMLNSVKERLRVVLFFMHIKQMTYYLCKSLKEARRNAS